MEGNKNAATKPSPRFLPVVWLDHFFLHAAMAVTSFCWSAGSTLDGFVEIFTNVSTPIALIIASAAQAASASEAPDCLIPLDKSVCNRPSQVSKALKTFVRTTGS